MTDTLLPTPEFAVQVPTGKDVTLVEGSNFCISDRNGDVLPDSPHGFFFRDTRYLSHWELLINGKDTEGLSVAVESPFAATFVARAHPRPGRADSTIMVFRNRYLGHGIREDIKIHNFAEDATVCVVEFKIDADFVNIFPVKEGRVQPKGEFGRSTEDNRRVVIRHAEGGNSQVMEVTFSHEIATVEGNSVIFEPIIPANGEWSLCIGMAATHNETRFEPRYACGEPIEKAEPTEQFTQWRNSVPLITTNHIQLATAVRKGQEDLGSLRIFDPDLSSRPVIAAGAPWFMTLFGRDSLITAWMSLIVDPSLAIGVLEALAKFQGTKVDPDTEEQPGRILHEMRAGSGDKLGFDKASIYYGSIDSTPLFVMLLGELRRWGLAGELTERLLPHADRALHWIENYGDRDGDGYVEYERTSSDGIENQGWKDSFDAIRFADGTLAQTPIALAEVQGYVYAAYQARKWFAREAGDHETAEYYRTKAKELKVAFNRDFWMEDKGYFAMALDKDKRQVDALASNMGHCLWTGIVDEDKAPSVAEKLFSAEMFSGWGIRTISSKMNGYNPIGYHAGSVWPHDSAIAAAGLSRYGFLEEARGIILGLLDAAMPDQGRLPELFSGLDRGVLAVPVNYPTSCSPQAWAAASPLLALRTLLRFHPSVPQGHLSLSPNLGDEIVHLRLERIPFDGRQISIEVSDGEVTVEGLSPHIRLIKSEAPKSK